MKLTLRHYFDFGADRAVVGDDLVRPEAWDALRTETSGAFALPETREQLEQAADSRPEIAARARELDAWLAQRDAQTLASYGAGAAVLELWLQRLRPERRLRLTDYAPRTVERLRSVLPEAEVTEHDLLRDPPLDADRHLFHRIDTELTDAQWHEVFQRFSSERVLVVATEVIDLWRVLAELRRRPWSRRASRAGWIRTRAAFEALWRSTHEATPLRFHDLEAWALEPRQGAA